MNAEGESGTRRSASPGAPPTPPLSSTPPILEAAEIPDDEAIDAALAAIAEGRPMSRTQSSLLRSMLSSVWSMTREGTSAGDLKIADAALAEMTEAFRVFRPYREVRKLTMFGSARTLPADPVYMLARDLAAHVAEAGWMVVTGAGPGIMAAGIEGAGADRSFGINIRLPFEQGANPFIAQDPKLVEMRYFFTRKLMLIKESHAYAVLPGGFGTLDECYELLTLLQTGKAEPAPVVLVETSGGSYWSQWQEFVEELSSGPGYVSADDLALYQIATTVDDAAQEAVAHGHRLDAPGGLDRLLLLELVHLAQDHGADGVLIEVEGETQGPVLEFQEFVHAGAGQSGDAGDAVPHLHDPPDLLGADRGDVVRHMAL